MSERDLNISAKEDLRRIDACDTANTTIRANWGRPKEGREEDIDMNN